MTANEANAKFQLAIFHVKSQMFLK